MLILAVHTVNTVTAKVAFSTILLQDFITNKKLPEEFKCRMLIPTSGSTSASLWDASDPALLLAWLQDNINVDCQHEVFEVQEDFGIGMGEVARSRATDRVTSSTKDVAKVMGAAATATVHSVQDIDSKLRISERAGNAVEAVRDSAVMQNTTAALTKAGSSVKSATTKVFEQPAVANATEAVGSGFRKLGASLSSLSSRVIPRGNEDTGGVAVAEIPENIDLGGGRGNAEETVVVNRASPPVSTSAAVPPPPPPTAPPTTVPGSP
jgi:hypothetical protein